MAKEFDPFGVLGTTGLKQTGGWIFEEFHRRLQGLRKHREYREFAENNAIAGAILLLIKNFIKQAPWRVEPFDESDGSKQAAEFLEEALDDMSHTFDDFLSELIESESVFGWAFFETVFKIRGGPSRNSKFRSKHNDRKIGWRKFAIRPPETLWRWDFSPNDGGLRGMWQTNFYGYPLGKVGQPQFIPIEKAMLFRTTSHKGNPEGRSLLRNGIRSYWFLKRMQEIEAIGIERDLAGYPVFEVPEEVISKQASGKNAALKQLAFDTVRQMRRDEREGAVIPPERDSEDKPTGWKLKLLSTGGRRQIVTNDVIRRYETRIAVTLLADFVMLGLDKVGVQSLASSKTHVFGISLGAWMDDIQETFNRFGVNRLMKLNGFPQETWPRLVHGDIETPPLDEIGTYVQQLTAAGVPLTDDATQRKLREIGKLPELELAQSQDVPKPRPGPAKPDEDAAAVQDAKGAK